MAEQVAVDLLINSAGAAKTVGELKQSLKDLKSAALNVDEGSKEFKKLTNAAAQAQARINDVNEGINALNPDKLGASFTKLGSSIAGGFQAATGAAALFGASGKAVEEQLLKVQAATAFAQGIQSVQDFGQAFKAFWLVLRANPLALIITSLGVVTTAFVLLKDKVKIFGDVYNTIADAVKKSVQYFKDLGDSIGLTNFKLDELREKAKKDWELAARREKWTANKLKENEEEEKRIHAEKQKRHEDFLKQQKDRETAAVNESARQGKLFEQELSYNRKRKAEEDRIKKEKEDAQKVEDDAILARMMAQFNANVASLKAKKAEEQKDREDKIAADKQATEMSFAISQASLESTQQLSDLYFDLRFSKIKKGSKEEEKIARQQFKINKALSLSQNIISTVVGITNALAQVPYPLNIVQAAAVGISGTLGTAKILRTQFGGGATDTTSDVSAPSGGAGSAANGVNINPVTSTTSTLIDPDKIDKGESRIKVFVTETDITSAQKGIKSIENKAKIG